MLRLRARRELYAGAIFDLDASDHFGWFIVVFRIKLFQNVTKLVTGSCRISVQCRVAMAITLMARKSPFLSFR